LGRAFAATWGRLFFGYLSFGEAKESISPAAKRFEFKIPSYLLLQAALLYCCYATSTTYSAKKKPQDIKTLIPSGVFHGYLISCLKCNFHRLATF
jgi:hypothetical protein